MHSHPQSLANISTPSTTMPITTTISRPSILSILTTSLLLLLYNPTHATPQPSPLGPPIAALLYTHSAGSKTCHGTPSTTLSLPRPIDASHNNTCTTLAQPAQCGIFVADTSDACEARLYSAPGCPEDPKELYVTTVAFGPDGAGTPVGGWWRSLEVRCRVWVDAAGLMRQQEGLERVFGGRVREGKSG